MYIVSIVALVVFLASLWVYRKFKKIILVEVPHISISELKKNPTGVSKRISSAAVASGQKIVVLDIPFKPIVVVTHPESAKLVLKNNETIQKFSRQKTIFSALIDTSLLFTNGETWRHQRSVMAPAFHYDYIKNMMPLFIQKSEEAFGRFPKNEVFDVKPWMSHMTVDIIGLASFGVDFKAMEEGSQNEYYSAYKTIIQYGRSSFRSKVPYKWREKLPFSDVIQARSAQKVMVDMTKKIAQQRKNIKSSDKKYLIDMMLESLPEEQITTNTFLFFLCRS